MSFLFGILKFHFLLLLYMEAFFVLETNFVCSINFLN